MWTAGLLLVLALGCATTTRPPPSTTLGPITGGQVVLGAILSASGGWPTVCKQKQAPIDNEDEVQPTICEYAQSRVDVACEGACRINKRSARPEVTALALGPLEVHVTQTHVESGKIDRMSFAIEVVKPTKLALTCLTSPNTYMPCGPDGVAAASPDLRVDVLLGSLKQYDVVVQINGVPRELRNFNNVSLAELFPDARDGDGIKPGSYAVELELGGVIERYQVVAQ